MGETGRRLPDRSANLGRLCAAEGSLIPLLTATTEISLHPASASPPPAVPPSIHVLPPFPYQVAILRLLKQLSEVYSTLKISSLAKLVPFSTFAEIEGVIVDAVRYDYLQVRRGGGVGVVDRRRSAGEMVDAVP